MSPIAAETSIARKAKEAIYAMAMEAKYSKDDILSIYLNRAYLGGGAYGAEAAAQRYFSKPASAAPPRGSRDDRGPPDRADLACTDQQYRAQPRRAPMW